MRGHLTWLDEAGAEVQADSEHRLERVSDCNVTLTVNFKSPGVKKLKCRAIVWSQVKALAELWVTVPGVCTRPNPVVVDHAGRNCWFSLQLPKGKEECWLKRLDLIRSSQKQASLV